MVKLPNYASLLETSRHNYVEWVNKVLESHNALVLDEFRIRFNLSKSCRYDIDRWLRYAFARRVRRLELDLSDYARPACGAQYDFPHDILGLRDGNSFDSCRNGINSDAILF
ncbi:OLC1v1028220C1 [Oldenlandia corymbosa var. corymbosa]|uniref:OLC1v1028220C1 n=1 Tax=Oldenlandia corymbosa var. corymbosa TaxID=529605 RepID=A0AAV1CBU8_OLDCO|nr:OLC1v1028220C1 [Oldenlandia corymbosa var. corymbosa]